MDKEPWTVLPTYIVKDFPDICLSLPRLVPQQNWRDRTISDYSFFGVNNHTVPLAHSEAMQFGQTLRRILQHIHCANGQFGPVCMSKIDLSDGFYRLWLRSEDTLKLAVLFPTRPGKNFSVPNTTRRKTSHGDPIDKSHGLVFGTGKFQCVCRNSG